MKRKIVGILFLFLATIAYVGLIAAAKKSRIECDTEACFYWKNLAETSMDGWEDCQKAFECYLAKNCKGGV